jgi:hypothetical protein
MVKPPFFVYSIMTKNSPRGYPLNLSSPLMKICRQTPESCRNKETSLSFKPDLYSYGILIKKKMARLRAKMAWVNSSHIISNWMNEAGRVGLSDEESGSNPLSAFLWLDLSEIHE